MICFPARLAPWGHVWLALGLMSAVCLAVGPVRARPVDPNKNRREVPFSEQTGAFRRLLLDQKYTPIKALTADPNPDPKDTILVVLGDTSFLERFGTGITPLGSFLENGGSVLLATDNPLSPRVEGYIAMRTHFRVDNAHFIYGGRDANNRCYLGKRYCPILDPIEPVPNGSPNLFRNPKGRGTPSLVVATNEPSRLVPTGGPGDVKNVRELAKLPTGIVNEVNNRGDPITSFLVSWQSAKGGRLLFLADHSIFINQMMIPDDNGNLEFASNCMEWLSEDGKRKKVLFYEEGEHQPSFDVPLGDMPLPNAPDEQNLVDDINRMIDDANGSLNKAEKSDLFNKWIHDFLTNGGVSPWHAIGVLLVLLTLVGLVAFFGRLVVHGVQQQQPMAPNLARLVERQQPDESLMAQRNQAMYQAGNLWEIGRLVARQMFEAAGFAAKMGEPLPRVAVKGGWWEQWKVRRRVARLWALAFAKKPSPVPPSEWPVLLRQLDELRRALASGSVRLG